MHRNKVSSEALTEVGILRANDRLGMDPDDLDYAKERFEDLNLTGEATGKNRTPSPPPPLNVDVHGLWDEEKHRQAGGRHRGPPRLKWNPPIRREALPKRSRDQGSRVEIYRGEEKGPTSRQASSPPGKKTRNDGSKRHQEDDRLETPNWRGGNSWSTWTREAEVGRGAAGEEDQLEAEVLRKAPGEERVLDGGVEDVAVETAAGWVKPEAYGGGMLRRLRNESLFWS